MKNKYYDIIQDKAAKTAEILIYGVIGDSWFEESTTAKQFVSDFKNLEMNNDRINVRLNSPGGSVWDGLAICNVILASAIEIHTYNDGLCASMAAPILLSVTPANVHPAKNSLLMLHSPMGGARGNRKQIEDTLTVLDKVQNSLVISLCDRTGLKKEEVEAKYFDYNDHWFTADEAKAEGLYTNIDDYEAENIPQNASTMSLLDLAKQFEPSNSIFADWIDRIAPDNKITSETDDTLTLIIDMDIQKLRDVYGLTVDKYPTEDDVLNFVKQREQDFKNLQTAKIKAENDLAAANLTITAKDAELVALGKKPGAQSAGIAPETDKIETGDEDEPAKDFMSAFSNCMNILKPQKSK